VTAALAGETFFAWAEASQGSTITIISTDQLMKHLLKKTTAFILSLLLLVPPGYGLTGGGSAPLSAEVPEALPFTLQLPEVLGTVDRLQAGRPGTVLIHIQEAHGDPLIQKRIEQILEHLKKNYGVEQVFVEGSAFRCHRNLLDFFPEQPALTRKAARRLMKRGLVSGPENFLLKNPEVSLSGIEDLKAYNRNSASFYRVLKQKEKTAGFLHSMASQMERLAGAYLNKGLREFINQQKDFDEGRLTFEALLRKIRPQMKKGLAVDLEKTASQLEWPMLVRMTALERWHQEFDPQKFDQERKAFLKAAGRFIPASKPILARLDLLLGSSGTPTTDFREIESLVEELAYGLPAEFDYGRYPHVVRRIGMAIIQGEITAERLMAELDRAIIRLEDHLAVTPREKETVVFLRDYRLAMKLLKLEWTRREYEGGDRQKAALNPVSLAARAAALNQEGRVKDVKFEHVEELESLYREALEFYRGAVAREAAMAASVEKQMGVSGNPKAVLITGGFHAAALENIFHEKKWNYARITPSMTEVKGRDSYVQSLLQNYYPGGGEARAGLMDIPYATTPFLNQRLMDRNPAVILASLAAVMTGLGVPVKGINTTAVMRQLTSGIGVTGIGADFKIQLGSGAQSPEFFFSANGELKGIPKSQVLQHWVENTEQAAGRKRAGWAQVKSEVRRPEGREDVFEFKSGTRVARFLEDDWARIFVPAADLQTEGMTLRFGPATELMTDDDLAAMPAEDLAELTSARNFQEYDITVDERGVLRVMYHDLLGRDLPVLRFLFPEAELDQPARDWSSSLTVYEKQTEVNLDEEIAREEMELRLHIIDQWDQPGPDGDAMRLAHSASDIQRIREDVRRMQGLFFLHHDTRQDGTPGFTIRRLDTTPDYTLEVKPKVQRLKREVRAASQPGEEEPAVILSEIIDLPSGRMPRVLDPLSGFSLTQVDLENSHEFKVITSQGEPFPKSGRELSERGYKSWEEAAQELKPRDYIFKLGAAGTPDQGTLIIQQTPWNGAVAQPVEQWKFSKTAFDAGEDHLTVYDAAVMESNWAEVYELEELLAPDQALELTVAASAAGQTVEAYRAEKEKELFEKRGDLFVVYPNEDARGQLSWDIKPVYRTGAARPHMEIRFTAKASSSQEAERKTLTRQELEAYQKALAGLSDVQLYALYLRESNAEGAAAVKEVDTAIQQHVPETASLEDLRTAILVEHAIRTLDQEGQYAPQVSEGQLPELTALSLTGYPARFFENWVMFGRLNTLLEQESNRSRPNVVRFIFDVLESAGAWNPAGTAQIPKGRFYNQPGGNLLWLKHGQEGSHGLAAHLGVPHLHAGTLAMTEDQRAVLPDSLEFVREGEEAGIYAVTVQPAEKIETLDHPLGSLRDAQQALNRLREALKQGFKVEERGEELKPAQVKRVRRLIRREIEIARFIAGGPIEIERGAQPSAQFPALHDFESFLKELKELYDKDGKRIQRSEVRSDALDPFSAVQTEEEIKGYIRSRLDLYSMDAFEASELLSNILLIKIKFGLKPALKAVRELKHERPHFLPDQTAIGEGLFMARFRLLADAEQELLKRPDLIPNTARKALSGELGESGLLSSAFQAMTSGEESGSAWIRQNAATFRQNRLDWPLFFYVLFGEHTPPEWLGPFLNQWDSALFPTADFMALGKEHYSRGHLEIFTDRLQNLVAAEGQARARPLLKLLTGEWVTLLYSAGWVLLEHPMAVPVLERLGPAWVKHFEERFVAWLIRWQEDPPSWLREDSLVRQEWFGFAWEFHSMPPVLREMLPEDLKLALPTFFNLEAMELNIREVFDDVSEGPPSEDEKGGPSAKSEVRSFPQEVLTMEEGLRSISERPQSLRSEVRSKSREGDFEAALKNLLGGAIGIKGPGSLQIADLSELVPRSAGQTWMGRGDAQASWGHPSLKLEKIPGENLQAPLQLIREKVAAAPEDVKPRAELILRHLEKIGPEWFDEQRYELSPKNLSYLTAHAEAGQIAVGRGFFAGDVDFAASALFRAAEESFKILTARQDQGAPKDVAEKVFNDQEKFSEKQRALVDLSDRDFLFSALSRFASFEPDSPYFQTMDLLKDWLRFQVDERRRDGDPYPVTEQAGFLLKKMWPLLTDEKERETKEMASAYFKVALPLYAFALYRQDFFRAQQAILKNLKKEIASHGKLFFEAVKFYNKALREAPPTRTVFFPPYPDHTADAEVLQAALDFVIALAKSPAGRSYDPFSMMRGEKQFTEKTAETYWEDRVQKDFRDGNRAFKNSPAYVLSAALPEILTPENAERFLKDSQMLGALAHSNFKWLRTAADLYAPSQEEVETGRVFVEGYVLGQAELPYRAFDPIQLWFGHVRADNLVAFSDNQNPEGFWLGLTRIVRESFLNLSGISEKASLKLMTGGSFPVSIRMAPRNMVYYNVSENGLLSVLVHKNSLISDFLYWLRVRENAYESDYLEAWEAPIAGIWPALLRLRLNLSASPALSDSYFSPLQGDFSAWADAVLKLRDIAEASYWKSVVRYSEIEKMLRFDDLPSAMLELYALFRDPEGLLANLASQLELKPGTRRLTDKATRAVVDTLAALLWSGTPREGRAETAFLFLLEAFRERMLFHPDGISIENLEELKAFLTDEMSGGPVDERAPDDFEVWSETTKIRPALPRYDSPGELDLGPRFFLPPHVDPETGMAGNTQIRPAQLPSFFDAEPFPAEDFLKSEKWPLWKNYRQPLIVEWTGRYGAEGLPIPGSPYHYLFKPESGIQPGDHIKVFWTLEPGADRSKARMRMVKLPPFVSGEGAKSEVRVVVVSQESENRLEEALKHKSYLEMLSMLRNIPSDQETGGFVADALPIEAEPMASMISHFRGRIMAADAVLKAQEESPLYIQAALRMIDHLESIRAAGKILTVPEVRRITEFGDYAYRLADYSTDSIVLSRELLQSEEPLLTQFLLFFSAAASLEKNERGWNSEERLATAELMRFLFPDMAAIEERFKNYLGRGLLLADLDAEQAQGSFGGEGPLWQKVPAPDQIQFLALTAIPDKVIQIPSSGGFELPGGQNGLFVFDLPAPKTDAVPERIALNIPELHGQNVRVFAHAEFERLDFYTHDGRTFIGRLEKKSGRFKSSTPRVNLLPPRGALTAELIPRTTVEYMALYGLEQGLSSLASTGRVYTQLRYLPKGISKTGEPRVQLDLSLGQIYVDPELVLEGENAYQQVLKALQEYDPVYLVRARTKAIAETNPFSSEPIPDLLPRFEESLLLLWPDRGERYNQSYGQMLRTHSRITLTRKIDGYREKNPAKFQKNGIGIINFRSWLEQAVAYAEAPDPEEFFFATKQRGGATQTLRGSQGRGPQSLQWQEPGVGIAVPAYFSANLEGQFTLGYNRSNEDPRRYLFLRYPDPGGSGTAMLDIFDLETGELIQNQEIQVRKSQLEYRDALSELIENAKLSQTQLNTERLQARIEAFLDSIQFPEEELRAYSQAKPQGFAGLYLTSLKIKLLGSLNHIFYSVLDSQHYSEAQNFMVVDMVLAYLSEGPVMGEKFGDDPRMEETQGLVARARKVSNIFSTHRASKTLLSGLELYLGADEDWLEFQNPALDSEDLSQLGEDLAERVLAPFAKASGSAAISDPSLDNPAFIEGLFEHIFKAIQEQIGVQAEAYFKTLDADKKREGFLSRLQDFLEKHFTPIEFPYRAQMIRQAGLKNTDITATERYFAEKILSRLDTEVFEKIPAAEKMNAVPVQSTVFGGAAEGIGASSTLFKYGSKGTGYGVSSVLVDTGIMIDERNTPPAWPKFDPPPDIVVETHVHLDHIGASVLFSQEYPDNPIPFYTTQGSYDLMPTVLGGVRGAVGGKAYTPEDIAKFMTRVYPLETGKWYEVTPEMKIYLHGPVGHLHGAASLLVSTPDSTGFVMGDISYRAQGPVPGWVDIPVEYRTHIDWAVIEATNGLSSSKWEEEEETALLDAVTGRLKIGGKVLLPAFANGRAQRELLLLLQRYALNPEYRDLKIYVDGQAAWFTLLYLQAYPEAFRPYKDWMKKNLVILPDPHWNSATLAKLSRIKEFVSLLSIRTHAEIYEFREEALTRQKYQPTIVIASSGNAAQGMSHWWAARLAQDTENGIYFGGYMDEDEAGGRLLQLARERNDAPGVLREFPFKDRVVFVNADILKFGLSGHIRGLDTLKILKTFGPSLKEVTIQHGGLFQRRALYRWIKERHPAWRPRLIKSGRSYASALPRTAEALRDRRTFFENLNAAPLPGRPPRVNPVPTAVERTLPEEPLQNAPLLAPEAPGASSAEDTPGSKTPEVAALLPAFPLAVDLAEPVEVSSSLVPVETLPIAERDSVSEEPSISEPSIPVRPPVTKEGADAIDKKEAVPPKASALRAKKISAKGLYDQIQTSGTLYNSIGKLTDHDLKVLAGLVDALPQGTSVLVFEKTRSHPKWQSNVTPAVYRKIETEFARRGLTRSEVRTTQRELEERRTDFRQRISETAARLREFNALSFGNKTLRLLGLAGAGFLGIGEIFLPSFFRWILFGRLKRLRPALGDTPESVSERNLGLFMKLLFFENKTANPWVLTALSIFLEKNPQAEVLVERFLKKGPLTKVSFQSVRGSVLGILIKHKYGRLRAQEENIPPEELLSWAGYLDDFSKIEDPPVLVAADVLHYMNEITPLVFKKYFDSLSEGPVFRTMAAVYRSAKVKMGSEPPVKEALKKLRETILTSASQEQLTELIAGMDVAGLVSVGVFDALSFEYEPQDSLGRSKFQLMKRLRTEMEKQPELTAKKFRQQVFQSIKVYEETFLEAKSEEVQRKEYEELSSWLSIIHDNAPLVMNAAVAMNYPLSFFTRLRQALPVNNPLTRMMRTLGEDSEITGGVLPVTQGIIEAGRFDSFMETVLRLVAAKKREAPQAILSVLQVLGGEIKIVTGSKKKWERFLNYAEQYFNTGLWVMTPNFLEYFIRYEHKPEKINQFKKDIARELHPNIAWGSFKGFSAEFKHKYKIETVDEVALLTRYLSISNLTAEDYQGSFEAVREAIEERGEARRNEVDPELRRAFAFEGKSTEIIYRGEAGLTQSDREAFHSRLSGYAAANAAPLHSALRGYLDRKDPSTKIRLQKSLVAFVLAQNHLDAAPFIQIPEEDADLMAWLSQWQTFFEDFFEGDAAAQLEKKVFDEITGGLDFGQIEEWRSRYFKISPLREAHFRPRYDLVNSLAGSAGSGLEKREVLTDYFYRKWIPAIQTADLLNPIETQIWFESFIPGFSRKLFAKMSKKMGPENTDRDLTEEQFGKLVLTAAGDAVDRIRQDVRSGEFLKQARAIVTQRISRDILDVFSSDAAELKRELTGFSEAAMGDEKVYYAGFYDDLLHLMGFVQSGVCTYDARASQIRDLEQHFGKIALKNQEGAVLAQSQVQLLKIGLAETENRRSPKGWALLALPGINLRWGDIGISRESAFSVILEAAQRYAKAAGMQAAVIPADEKIHSQNAYEKNLIRKFQEKGWLRKENLETTAELAPLRTKGKYPYREVYVIEMPEREALLRGVTEALEGVNFDDVLKEEESKEKTQFEGFGSIHFLAPDGAARESVQKVRAAIETVIASMSPPLIDKIETQARAAGLSLNMELWPETEYSHVLRNAGRLTLRIGQDMTVFWGGVNAEVLSDKVIEFFAAALLSDYNRLREEAADNENAWFKIENLKALLRARVILSEKNFKPLNLPKIFQWNLFLTVMDDAAPELLVKNYTHLLEKKGLLGSDETVYDLMIQIAESSNEKISLAALRDVVKEVLLEGKAKISWNPGGGQRPSVISKNKFTRFVSKAPLAEWMHQFRDSGSLNDFYKALQALFTHLEAVLKMPAGALHQDFMELQEEGIEKNADRVAILQNRVRTILRNRIGTEALDSLEEHLTSSRVDDQGHAKLIPVFDITETGRLPGEEEPVNYQFAFLGLERLSDFGMLEPDEASDHSEVEDLFPILIRPGSRSEVRNPVGLTVPYFLSQDSTEALRVTDLKRQSAVRIIFAETLLPLSWSPRELRAELRRLLDQKGASLGLALAHYPQLLRAAKKISAGELARQIIDQRNQLPSVEELVPTLALLSERSSLSYILVAAAPPDEIGRFQDRLKKYLRRADIQRQWGRIRLDKLTNRFRIESIDLEGLGIEMALKTAVIARVLSGKQNGMKSAVVAESQTLSRLLFEDAQRYRFLNLYTPKGLKPAALVWMSAELLDELTDDLLARFDNQALLKEARWQGLWSEMQQLLLVQESA